MRLFVALSVAAVTAFVPPTRVGDSFPKSSRHPSPERRPLTRAAAEPPARTYAAHTSRSAHATLAPRALNDVVKQYCGRCHNATMKRGNLSLASFDVASAPANADVAEKMVAKLRIGMMPPAGSARPSADTINALIATLERQLDSAAAANPDPGHRTFQRLNRAEYRASVNELLGLDVDAGVYLPPDTKSDNFDNIADVQVLSPMLLDGYLRAASDISWLAVGNLNATTASHTYTMPKMASQTEHVEGTPFGTRGGMAVDHVFPADGEYRFDVNFFHETTGAFAGGLARGEKIEISVDGERVALLDIDRFMTASDPNGVGMATEAVRITAGKHRLAAAFIPPGFQSVSQELISPLKYSLFSTSNATAYGFAQVPHLREFTVKGPLRVTGVSETPTRRRIFSCRPAENATREVERTCATSIVNRLATLAYRRPLTNEDRDGLLSLYDAGRAQGAGFEQGVRAMIEGMLASPDFVFRFERVPNTVNVANPRGSYALRDLDLASRLSFFLWSAPPDRELIALATQNRLSQPAVLERQVRRMLADSRASSLSTRFAAQWLRLPDLDGVQPDIRQYPDFDEQLRAAMRKETELFFDDIVKRDRSVLQLYAADYTFVNEQLARHYGIPNVAGPAFRRVAYTDSTRRGILSHASVLTLTSHAGRTSAVERGKWVMEVLLNSPPPPPPPGVPDLEATPGAANGRLLTVRERMEEHRKSPACSSCHKMMDPIGLALEGFDVTGRVRVRDNGMPVDTRGELWDGTSASTVRDLQAALMRRQETLLRTFTKNLMAYGVGRRVEASDMPTIRRIVRDAGTQQNRLSAYILGVVMSPAFRQQRVETPAVTNTAPVPFPSSR
jgi:cytochrome c5